MKQISIGFICFLSIITAVLFCLGGCDGSGGDSDATGILVNIAPVWSPAPVDITVNAGESYFRINGRALDDNRPSQSMACVAISDTCSFNVDVGGIGSGAINCLIRFTAGNTLEVCNVDILAGDEAGAVISQTININVQGGIGILCSPNPADEGAAVNCSVTAAGGTEQIDVLNDTCGGALAGGLYSFTTDENDGSSTCFAAVELVEDTAIKDSEQITINEVNQTPVISSVAPTSASEGTTFTYSPAWSDADLPNAAPGDPGYTTCAISGNTCGAWLSFVGCNASGTPGETDGGGSCGYAITVTDGYGASAVQDVNLTINEVNQAPTWTTPPVNISVLTGQAYNTTNGIASDADLPAQSLTCSGLNNTCSFGVTISGSGAGAANCNVSFTAVTPETCGVDVQVSDGSGGIVFKNIQISVQQCRIFVDIDATGANDGSSWTNGFTVIQNAVDASWASCEIWVAEGDYHKAAPGTGPVLTMKNGVKIYGGFTGTETTLVQRLNPAAHATTLNGENTSYHVVVGASNSLLDWFYIVGGNANGGGENDYGGGMYNDNSAPTITNCTFSGNSATMRGGGMYNYNFSHPAITNCTFSGNSATLGGGMNDTWHSSPTITNCAFSGNSAQSGGGLYNYLSGPSITNSTFSGNSATNGGGMYLSDTSSTAITNCTFSGNTVTSSGGGIYNYSFGNPRITNCMFTGNSADLGGGMYNYSQTFPDIFNCTFSGNSANSGGGMYNYSTTSYPTINNSITWGDTATVDPEIHDVGSATVKYSDIQGGCAATGSVCGVGNINSDPLFIAGTYGNYYLSQTAAGQAGDSPCVNTGNPGLSSPGGTTATNNAADTGIVDMGYHYPIP